MPRVPRAPLMLCDIDGREPGKEYVITVGGSSREVILCSAHAEPIEASRAKGRPVTTSGRRQLGRRADVIRLRSLFVDH
jgi:hypothetical protein